MVCVSPAPHIKAASPEEASTRIDVPLELASSEKIDGFSPGGRNVMADRYVHSEGYPLFPIAPTSSEQSKVAGTTWGSNLGGDQETLSGVFPTSGGRSNASNGERPKRSERSLCTKIRSKLWIRIWSINSRGVSISLFAGGTTGARSLDYNGNAYVAEGFGVPWFHLFLYAGTHANTAEEAIELLTLGHRDYRSRTGRKTILHGGGWIFMVSDSRDIAVVEVTANRYAIRRPGQFTGAAWCDPDYIVATNHNLCDYSFDAMNRPTDIPMTIFGDGLERDPMTGTVTGLDNSGIRFWTLMWDVKRQRGKLNASTSQQIMSGLHSRDRTTGRRKAGRTAEGNSLRIWGRACNQGTVSLSCGTADGKVAVLRNTGTEVRWTMGSPSHWRGAWDTYCFQD